MHPSSTVTAQLAQGEQYVVPAGQAVRLHLVQGTLDVAGPWQWLAETAWRPRCVLRAGECLHLVADSSLTLTACTPCVVQLAGEPAPAGLAAAWWARLFRRRAAGAASPRPPGIRA